MKRIASILIWSLVALVVFASGSHAFEMPDLSVDGYLLYSLDTNLTTFAPGLSASVVKFADGIVEGNIGVAFPAQNDDQTKSYVAGPIIDINLVKALAKIKGAEIITKDLKLSAGIGVMFDVFHLNHNSLKGIVMPAAHLRFTF